MEAKGTLQQDPSENQSTTQSVPTLAEGMSALAHALRRLVEQEPSEPEADEPDWSESADWQDFLASHDDQGVR